ncbi:MAG: signal recognition particle-docking protein FtsY [Rickettsiales bacterium]|jgi:fused signal recognition particle receptor|nr:signal recognition particle-docking protein FtsY [Rickettsiales bacterium]
MFSRLGNSISKIFKSSTIKLDENKLIEIEENLLLSDISIDLVDIILQQIKSKKFDQNISAEEVKFIIKSELKKQISLFENADLLQKIQKGKLFTIIFSGINGAGKTTTVAKLASQLKNIGYKVLVCAADTFRVVATEQLQSWTDKVGVEIITSEKSDPSGLVFDAYKRASAENFDVLLIDTAGRLQSRTDLMDELQKIIRVLQKQNEYSPDESVLVLDASIGQNMLSQADAFLESASISGFILTKLDGTSKGGAVISLMKKYHLPVYMIGVGEHEADLQKFDIDYFLDNVLDLK